MIIIPIIKKVIKWLIIVNCADVIIILEVNIIMHTEFMLLKDINRRKWLKENRLKDGGGDMASNIHKAIAPIINKIIKDFDECKKIKLIIINDENYMETSLNLFMGDQLVFIHLKVIFLQNIKKGISING